MRLSSLMLATLILPALACGDDDENVGGAGGAPTSNTTAPAVTSTSSPATTVTSNQSTIASQSTTSGPMYCIPGDQRDCYGGAPGTEGIGACHGGLTTCDASGAFYGDCEGDVVPALEACGAQVDVDCDGGLATCAVAFQRAYENGGPDVIADDDDGNLLVAGGFSGVANFGGGPLLAGGNSGTFLLKTDAEGNHVWSQAFDGDAIVAPNGIATGPDGSVVLLGRLQGTTDFGGGPLTVTTGVSASYLAKFDAMGNHVFSRLYQAATISFVNGVAVDSLGDIVLVGNASGDAIDFGGGATALGGFVVKLDAAGDHLWTTSVGEGGAHTPAKVVVDDGGDVTITGLFAGTRDFGDGQMRTSTDEDVYVVRLDAQGETMWSWTGGGPDYQTARQLGVDGTGAVLVAGRHEGMIDFGTGPIQEGRLFVIKLTPDGALDWFRHFGDHQDQFLDGLALDDAGDVVLVGTVQGDIDFGGGPLTNGPLFDCFVAGLGPNGNHLWSRSFGGDGNQFARAVLVDDQQRVVVGGSFGGMLDFGAGPMGPDGAYLVGLLPPL